MTMSYNNHYRNSNVNNNQRGQRGNFQQKQDVIAEFCGDKPYDPIALGERVAKEKRFSSQSQIRNILSLSVKIYNTISRDKTIKDELPQNVNQDINYLMLRLVYQMGRDKDLKNALSNELIDMPQIIKNINGDKGKFECFYRLLEAIIAYKKFYESK